MRSSSASPGIARRLGALGWTALEASLAERGFARTPPLVTAGECAEIASLWHAEARFRSRIDMERHRFGVGAYKYFAAPLPPLVRALRIGAYRRLAPIANRWAEALGEATCYPPTLAGFLARCHRAGQHRPPPHLLPSPAGGYHCPRRDLD